MIYGTVPARIRAFIDEVVTPKYCEWLNSFNGGAHKYTPDDFDPTKNEFGSVTVDWAHEEDEDLRMQLSVVDGDDGGGCLLLVVAERDGEWVPAAHAGATGYFRRDDTYRMRLVVQEFDTNFSVVYVYDNVPTGTIADAALSG